MNINMEFKGLDELIRNVESLASESEMNKVNRKIIKIAADKGKELLRSRITRSKDNSKSGKAGYRPSGHYADNIPQTGIKKKGKFYYCTLGETKDEGMYFYWNFKEWGTSKIAPTPVFAQTKEEVQQVLDSVGIKAYEKLLREKLGG